MIAAEYHEVMGATGFIEIAGDGPALFCIHTAGQTGAQWRHVLQRLSGQGYKVIVPDLPGHGRSDGAPDGPVEDFAYYREWCLGLLTKLGVERAYLAGCSLGGRMVLDLAGSAPQRALGVVSMAANPDLRLLSENGLRRELEGSASPSRADRTYYGTLASVGAATSPERAREIARRHCREDPAVSSADLIGWVRHDLEPLLPRISAPVRLLAGAEDFWLDPARLDRMGEQIPDCTVETLAGIGHYMQEEIEDFPDLLGSWLAEMKTHTRGSE
jgi:pimeloyl-ACP methyl ester carboxylesterase